MTDADNGWYLRHRDGIEHGPFRFADILAAAKLGNIASDTCVRHESKTLGQWVYAPRVQSISEVMPQVAPRQVPMRAVKGAANPAAIRRETAATLASSPAATQPVATAAEVSPKPAPTPVVRTHREPGYPVPRTFVDACIALFDFRFRSFVTPWIVKILWAICVAGVILWAGRLAYENFIQGEVSANRAAAAVGATGEWQFEPLGDQPFLQSKFFRFLVKLAALSVSLLCIRVVCEAAIVLFRAATDLHELKTQEKE